MLGIVVALTIGKLLTSGLTVRTGIATKPNEYSWLQLIGAGGLAGIGFTMSLFIASEAFPLEEDFAAAKIALLAASVISALVGVTVLWTAGPSRGNRRCPAPLAGGQPL